MTRRPHIRASAAPLGMGPLLALQLTCAGMALAPLAWAPGAPGQAMANGADTDSGPVRIEATVDSHSVLLGDVLRYDLLVQWEGPFETPLVDPGLTLGPFEVLDADIGPIEDLGARGRQRRIGVQLTTFELGEQTIPSVTARYRSHDGATTGVVATAPMVITVRGVEGADMSADVRDLAGPLDLRRSLWARALLATALLVVLAALAWALWVWRRRRATAREAIAVVDTRTIDEIALAELEALAAQLPDDEASAMAFYVRLSEIIRVFLGRRYRLDALDRTTSELVSLLRGRLLSSDQIAPISEFLDECDLIKFARFPSDRRRAAEALGAGRRIVLVHRPLSDAQEQTA